MQNHAGIANPKHWNGPFWKNVWDIRVLGILLVVAGVFDLVWISAYPQLCPESVWDHIRRFDGRICEISASRHSLDTWVWVLEATTLGILWVPRLFRVRVLE